MSVDRNKVTKKTDCNDPTAVSGTMGAVLERSDQKRDSAIVMIMWKGLPIGVGLSWLMSHCSPNGLHCTNYNYHLPRGAIELLLLLMALKF